MYCFSIKVRVKEGRYMGIRDGERTVVECWKKEAAAKSGRNTRSFQRLGLRPTFYRGCPTFAPLVCIAVMNRFIYQVNRNYCKLHII